jgi:hypothetical protein
MLYIQDILIKIFNNFRGIFQEDFKLPNACNDITLTKEKVNEGRPVKRWREESVYM